MCHTAQENGACVHNGSVSTQKVLFYARSLLYDLLARLDHIC